MSSDTDLIQNDIIRQIWRRHEDGTERFVPDMPDEYLTATILMLQRGYDSHSKPVQKDRDEYLPMLQLEASKRGLEIKEEGWDDDTNL